MKVFCTNESNGYASWLRPLGIKTTNKVEEADMLLITGGVDVNPALYNQKHGYYTDQPDYKRDSEESALFKVFIEAKKPILGVCRGSQLLCVMNGGELVQHSGHPMFHPVETQNKTFNRVISTHHQQALLRNVKNYELIAWTNKLSRIHLDGNNRDYNFGQDYKEPEIVFYPETNSLAIQSHPEIMDINDEWVTFCQSLVQNNLLR